MDFQDLLVLKENEENQVSVDKKVIKEHQAPPVLMAYQVFQDQSAHQVNPVLWEKKVLLDYLDLKEKQVYQVYQE